MSNVASLELSQRLYELSGWEDTDKCYTKLGNQWRLENRKAVNPKRGSVPAYDLGYTLRKLPDNVHIYRGGPEFWTGTWNIRHHYDLVTAATPEDAAVKLCLALFEQGVLHKGGEKS